MKVSLLFFLVFISALYTSAQNYTDYLGAGHTIGITVTTGHTQNANNRGDKLVDGFPITDAALLADASRFLAQATLGYDYNMIEMAAAMGYEAWLDEQFALPRNAILDQMVEVATNGNGFDGPVFELDASMDQFRYAWWDNHMKNPDMLRHKMNYVLSQIFVVSAFGSDLFEDIGDFSSVYYDVLGQNTFGNFRTLLSEVSLNPMMGIYLSHLNNPRSDPANNIHPDENYAREVMQLFSIGLYELNPDGSRRLDANGNVIPTYNNEDIREFAKIFTGFGDGGRMGEWGGFGTGSLRESGRAPMIMYEEHHEPGQKFLLNGQVVPAGQTGMQDFNAAMDNLFNHPNVGPFIGKALIQFLVSSNPSPAYIERVSRTFDANCNGVRGDMKAVIKAILLDPEARSCNALANPTGGMLREPIVRYTNFLKAFQFRANPYFEVFLGRWYEATGQIPLFASTVFNFFQPNFQPNGPIANQNLVAPVFQIHNSSTSIGFVNQTDDWTLKEEALRTDSQVAMDLSAEMALANTPAALVDRLSLLLAAGQISPASKSIIVNALNQLNGPADRVNMAIYLILISPDYAILK
ncbi:MAG: DUF1800 family protein [Bacteroidota bacterium]